MTKDTSGPAFPCQIHNKSNAAVKGFIGETIAPGEVMIYEGASMREYAAIKAMQGMFASGMDDPEYVAMRAVKAADALLAELEK